MSTTAATASGTGRCLALPAAFAMACRAGSGVAFHTGAAAAATGPGAAQ